jgi:hypothetical protein
MGVISELIDGVVEITTGSADVVASKWSALVGGVLGLVALLLLVILLAVSPTLGVILAIVLLATLWIFVQGDNDLI